MKKIYIIYCINVERCDVSQLWENVKNWIKNIIGINITLTTTMKTVGYLVKDQNFWPLNMILTTTRKYIFWCSRNKFKLNIYLLQKEVKNTFLEQHSLCRVNSRLPKSTKNSGEISLSLTRPNNH